jgi:ABC-type glycerol-3-phosphate transport system substrate-binding protein
MQNHCRFLLFLLCLAGPFAVVPVLAQSSEIVLTVGLQQWQTMFYGDEIFTGFEASHPGVQVVTVTLPNEGFVWPETTVDVPLFIENITSYSSNADLLPIVMPGTPSLYTRAGLYLDIGPLLYADMKANIDDFYPVMLESMQWDGGTWGLPISGSLQFIVYNENRFNALGLALPEPNWNIQDWMNAGRLLTVYDTQGDPSIPGIFGIDDATFLAAVYGRSLFEPNNFPSQALLNDPELIVLLETWAEFRSSTQPNPCCTFDWDAIPISSGGIWDTDPVIRGSNDIWLSTFYPQGKAGLSVQGYGISSATENPQLAYELLQFMTTSLEMVAFNPGPIPARQSMEETARSSQFVSRPEYTPEIEALIAEGIANALPASHIASFNYVVMAMGKMIEADELSGLTAEEALLAIQEQNILISSLVDEQAIGRMAAIIPTPVPAPNLESHDIALNFGLAANYQADIWQAAITDFVAQDPEVRHVEINPDYLGFAEHATTQDCFYQSYNSVQTADLSLIRNLDPYMQADASFDPGDMVTATIEQVSREMMLWAMPMSLSPQTLWFDPAAFATAGLPEPDNTWTVSEWENAMRTLYNGVDPVFQTRSWGGNYILMLAAANGGLPIDYTTYPASIRSDAAAINATMEVLDLAKEGLIAYQELGSNTSPSVTLILPFYDAPLIPIDSRFQNREGLESSHRPVLFPSGSSYTPLSYTLSVAYISSQSPLGDACYRWLSFIARRPELHGGIPARRSNFELSLITETLPLREFYQAFDTALASPNALIIPQATISSNIAISISNNLANIWLYRAFDNYVLRDANLEADLIQAQIFQADFSNCIAGFLQRDFAEFDANNQDEYDSYYMQLVECALAIDPSLQAYF